METLIGDYIGTTIGMHSPHSLLGGPFDLVSRVSKVGYGDYNRVSRGY